MIENVHATLTGLAKGFKDNGGVAPRPEPAIDPKNSVTDDYIICLEDGQRFKSLKRHLMKAFGLTPERYRERWQLERSYPMVAPNYAAIRSQTAKNMAMGRKQPVNSPNFAYPLHVPKCNADITSDSREIRIRGEPSCNGPSLEFIGPTSARLQRPSRRSETASII
jgi:predicted transcriptional regulator